MISFPSLQALSDASNFSADDVLRGTLARSEQRGEPGRIWVEVDGVAESLCFYGAQAQRTVSPLIYLEGDCSRRTRVGSQPILLKSDSRWTESDWAVFDGYDRQSPYSIQLWAEQISIAIDRTFISVARPGVYGSSGNHQQRRRPREVAVVDAALTALKDGFGWEELNLAGFSGGGHLVAALMAKRSDIGCAVIASGNVSVRQRNVEMGLDADVTGYSDFVDPIDLVGRVADHPPRRVIVLTDPQDHIVSAACQTAYVEALRSAGVSVEHRYLASTEQTRHLLRDAALFAAAAALAREPPPRA